MSSSDRKPPAEAAELIPREPTPAIREAVDEPGHVRIAVPVRMALPEVSYVE